MIRAFLVLACLASPAAGQVLGDRQTLDCAALVEGEMVDASIQVVCGIPAEQMTEMMRLAVSGRAEDYSELLFRLDDLTPEGSRLKAESLRSFFQILREDQVPDDQVRDRLAEIARRHIQLQDQLADLQVADPEIQARIDAAAAALAADPPDHDQARARLAEARELRRQKREAAQMLLDDQSREEARISRRQAELEASVLNRLAAAALYVEAGDLWPDGDLDQRRSDIFAAAGQLYDHGLYQGDNEALRRATQHYRELLTMTDRLIQPLDWAAIQNNLGNALSILGSRESGPARLEEAVAAYRAALEEITRERVPLEWAMTQNNLGSALFLLGERETGTERLDSAVAAFRAALEVQTRKGAPLDWATTQTNLGAALSILGKREPGTAHLEEAVLTYRSALEEYTRELVPLDWAWAQNNLGAALSILGEREPGTARLEEAVLAYRAALEKYTRERVPLDWAGATAGLSYADALIAERTGRIDMARQALTKATEAEVVLRQHGHTPWAEEAEAIASKIQVIIARMEAR